MRLPSKHELNPVGTLDGKSVEKWRQFLRKLRVVRHQEVYYDIDVGSGVPGRYGVHELKVTQIVPLKVAMFLQDFRYFNILAVAQGGRVETKVDIDGSTVGHVGVV